MVAGRLRQEESREESWRVAQYAFLSDEWLAEARRLRAEYRGRIPEIPVSLRMNQVVEDVPFGEGTIMAHLDTSSGELVMESGHLDSPDLTITVAYDTAKALLVDGNAQAAMQAFLSGRIKVDGDISKLLALQNVGMAQSGDPGAVEFAKRVQEMTA
jgi:hypothetical protein